MCKTNVQTNFYYVNICKYEHEKARTQDRAKTCVKQTK
jgi:hypothetical protein